MDISVCFLCTEFWGDRILLNLWTQAPLATRARLLKDVSVFWAVATKAGVPDIVCVSFLGDTNNLRQSRECRWCLPCSPPISGENCSWPLDLGLFRSLLPGHTYEYKLINRLLSQKGQGCIFSLWSLHCVLGWKLVKNCPVVIVWVPWMSATRARQSRGVPWAAAAKTGEPAAYTSSSL